MATAASFFPTLTPRYGVDPDNDREDYNPGDEYEKKTRYWLEASYEEAKYELSQNEEVKTVGRYVDYLLGKQWPAGRPTYRAAPVDNRIWRLMWELVALLTDIRPMFEIRASENQYKPQADMLNNVTRSWWLNSDADMNLAMVIIYALLTTGYSKLCWNPELRNMEGDFEILPLGPNDILPLKARNQLQDAQAMIYQTVRPLGFFRNRYPLRGHLVQPDPAYSRYATTPDRPGHVPMMIYDSLSPAMKRILKGQDKVMESTYPEALYREFWIKDWTYNESNRTVLMGEKGTNWCYSVKPGERLYPRGRLLIMGGRVLLYDGPNPYWHGEFPFHAMRMNIVPWQFMGLSEFSPLLPLQDIINNVLAGVLDAVKKAVNPGFYAPKNAFGESQWTSLDWGMPGFKAAYSPQAAQKPEFAPAPVLPAFVLQVLGLASREMDQSSGIQAIDAALQKKQVPGFDTLESIKQAKQTPIRLKERNIEVFLRGMGSQNVWNIFQFYTAKRRMYMLGDKGLTFEDFDWDPGTCVPAGTRPEDHARRFQFLIKPGTLLNLDRDKKAMLFLRLRAEGDLSRKTLFAGLDVGLDQAEEEKELLRERTAGVPMVMPAKGHEKKM